MISGLAAGIIAAAGIVVAITALSGSLAAVLFVVFFSSLILLPGLALALFPIGPLWMVIASILVHYDTRNVWAYAAAGAAAATGMPFLLAAWILVLLTETPAKAAEWLVWFAWFALSGAIGGAFAGARIVAILRADGSRAG